MIVTFQLTILVVISTWVEGGKGGHPIWAARRGFCPDRNFFSLLLSLVDWLFKYPAIYFQTSTPSR